MDSAFRKKVGKRIKEKRDELKLTQGQVAKKAGIKTNYFAVIERGEVLTNGGYMQQIADALGVDLNELTK